MAQDFCAILLWGSVGFLAFLVPAQLSFQLSRTLLPGTRLLAFITFATTVAILPIQSARLGDGWVDAFNLDVLRDVLFQSNIGLSWFYQLATALLVLIAATIFPKL
jgi:putative copper resistance protein D